MKRILFLGLLILSMGVNAQTTLKLKSDGKMYVSNRPLLDNLLFRIPAGTDVQILEQPDKDGYYKVGYQGKTGFINELWFDSIVHESFSIVHKKGYPDEEHSVPNSGSGTGFAISSDGYIVTNYHVVIGAKSIKVRGINGDFSESYTAKVVKEDPKNDIAIIKINDHKFTSIGTIPYIVYNQKVDVGISVYALGYPLRTSMGNEVKLTNGIISANSGFQDDVTSYQISVPIQPGNSGGPLFNDKGNVIGIVSAKHTGAENASYAIKTSFLINLINSFDTFSLPSVNQISEKPMSEQVKAIKKFVYIIEIN
jgi:S1-C subfamily serine protease